MSFSRSISLFGGALAATVLVAPAMAQDAKATFEARYAELHTAMLARDSAAIGKIMAPDYTMEDIQGGTHDMTEVSAQMANMPAIDPTKAPKTKVLSATITGDTALVSQQMDVHISRPSEDGGTDEMDVTIISDDTWALRGGVWVLVKTNQKDLSVAKDGEVVAHMAK